MATVTARHLNRLTAREVGALKKPGRHSHGGNLYLDISANGRKSWTFLYSRAGQQREIGLGPLHVVGLAEARKKAAETRRQLAGGIALSAPRKPPWPSLRCAK